MAACAFDEAVDVARLLRAYGLPCCQLNIALIRQVTFSVSDYGGLTILSASWM